MRGVLTSQQQTGTGAGVLVAVLLGLGVGFGDLTQPSPMNRIANADDNYELPYKKPIVETVSTAADVKLAKHLTAKGAKFYGAFWCSHCFDQKVQFGAEAAALLPYVECFPEGYRRVPPSTDLGSRRHGAWDTAMEKLRIVILGFGTALQKMVLE
jgi:hypothetical protein